MQTCRLLVGVDGLPALIHCAAGKDRTGVVVGVLLSALGVLDVAVVADYSTPKPIVSGSSSLGCPTPGASAPGSFGPTATRPGPPPGPREAGQSAQG